MSDTSNTTHHTGSAAGTIQTVLTILELVGEYAPSVFQGLAAFINDIKSNPPTTLSDFEVKAKAHNVDLHEIAKYARTHLVHK